MTTNTSANSVATAEGDASPVVHATDSNFGGEVLGSDQVVLVDFWAPWCGPCRMVGPIVDQLASEYDGQAKVVKVNIDDSTETATKYGIRSIPSLLVFKDGEPIDRLVGAVPKAKLAETLEKYL